MAVHYERTEVAVDGGTLAVGRWGTGSQIVFASHGITANHLSFARIAELVVERSEGESSLVALDHRGRAGSASCPGPFGLRAHADDLAIVMDHFEIDHAILTGHSLGGFIVANAAEWHAERVDRLVLIDGGLPLPGARDLPDDADIEAVVQAVIGPALDRLDMRWKTENQYVEFFRAHPAFQPPNEWTATIEAYVRYDAKLDDGGRVKSSVNKEAVLTDGGAAIVDPKAASSIERVDVDTDFLWCPRGLLDQEPGLYTMDYAIETEGLHHHVRATEVLDTNHYTIVTADVGASVVVDTILGLS